MAAEANADDGWFCAKVQEAFDDPRRSKPHSDIMQDAQALIEAGREQKS